MFSDVDTALTSYDARGPWIHRRSSHCCTQLDELLVFRLSLHARSFLILYVTLILTGLDTLLAWSLWLLAGSTTGLALCLALLNFSAVPSQSKLEVAYLGS